MPSHSKPVNSNYFLSVENMLEEGLSEHDHITLNTTVHCVTKQQIDNRKFIHEPTTIVLHKLSCKPWKKSTQPTANKRSSTENNNFCFETPINSKISDSWLINLTRSPRKKDSRGHPPPHPLGNCLRLDLPSPPLWISVALCGGVGGGWIFSRPTHSIDKDNLVPRVLSYPSLQRVGEKTWERGCR